MCGDKTCADGRDCTGRRDEWAVEYDKPTTRQIARTAAEVEAQLYGEACRLEELIEFARRMGYRRLGVAFCIGLSEEAERLVEILKDHFEVSSVCCKVCGLVDPTLLGEKARKGMSRANCNPVGQAHVLNDEATDLNVIVGLCIGHDILFVQHSRAPVTTFIVKDRVLAHNPVGALYSRYPRRRLQRRLLGQQDGKHDKANG
jgi:uncharacterized metal-binding protein